MKNLGAHWGKGDGVEVEKCPETDSDIYTSSSSPGHMIAL
jgi:hypothetical protein